MTKPQKSLLLDGTPLPFEDGDTVMAAAHRAGKLIPHLCWHPRLGQSGACRLCTVKVDGRLSAACTTRAAEQQVVESHSAELDTNRRMLTQMLFVEGNHFCPSCEKSGNCKLQSSAYQLGMTDPHFEEFYPRRTVDASHPDMWFDANRCILCKLCVRASHEVDGKDVFAIQGHGIATKLCINSPTGRLGDSTFSKDDFAATVCPVGAILPKRQGFCVPIGQRAVDQAPLSSTSVEAHHEAP